MRASLGVLIVAGGGGTRLWPLSREAHPKPFLPLADGISPLRRTVALGLRTARGAGVWVITAGPLSHRVRAHLSGARVRVLVEPCPRDTAAALALGTAHIHGMTGAEWILCLPADQWVRRASAFARLARRIAQDSEGRDRLITFGMRPRFAHPGYGYIRVGKPLGKLLRRAARFVEKPPLARARRYLRSKRWLWNGGMFLWRAETFLAEVETLLPEVAGAVADLTCGIRRRRRAGLRRWRALKPLSVDHGVLEHSGRVAVAPCEVGWQDLGSWESAASIWPRASDGTRHRGGYVSIDGSDCLVYAPQQTTVNLGVQKTGLVVTQDAILIFDRSRHEQVRRVVDLLHRQPMLARYR